MESLRTAEKALSENAAVGVIFVIAPEPSWPHYHPEECPGPIQKWLAAHYPYAAVEKLSGFECDYGYPDDDGSRQTASQFLPGPLFRLGLTSEGALHFEQAWSNPPLHTEAEPSDFYLIVCGSEDAVKALGWASSAEFLEPLEDSDPITSGSTGD